jgi:hypothetical protein
MPRTQNSYNNVFSPLLDEIECSICNNFGHKENECRSKMLSSFKKDKKEDFTKIWKKKRKKTEECGLSLYAKNQENQWYIDSGCSKHMTGDKSKFESLNEEKGGSVTFGNNAPTRIRGKGIVVLDKGKTKAHNVLYVDGLKHNLLSVIQMCDQGYNVLFHSTSCKVMNVDSGKTIVKEIRTPGNVYVLEGGKESCCMGKTDESWLWNKRLGHLSFSQLVKLGRKSVVRDMPKISKPENVVYKSCQFGKQSRVQFKEKEQFYNMTSRDNPYISLWTHSNTIPMR